MTDRPSAKQIRDSFEQPTMWEAVAQGGGTVESCHAAPVVGSAPLAPARGGTTGPCATAPPAPLKRAAA